MSDVGFNRNIMECKGHTDNGNKHEWYVVLIETLWNVKYDNVTENTTTTKF